MKKILLFACIAVMAITACTEFDDSAIWDKLSSYEERLAALEKKAEAFNEDIFKLQTLVEAIDKRESITSVYEEKDLAGNVLRYIISFSSGRHITINNGKDGIDSGEAPKVGLYYDEEDGNYYWTLNNELMLDNNGKPIKANGTDGKDGVDGTNGKDGVDGTNGTDGKDGINGTDGKDGVTPKLKIENNYWYVSYDNGATWTLVGQASTGGGNSGGTTVQGIITAVTVVDNEVIFTLVDGSTISVPKSDNYNEPGTEPVDPEKVYQDKEDFQNIALELRDEFKASDFENIMELAEYIGKEYAEYETEKVENWFESCWEEIWREIDSKENYEIYESIYKLSVFKGKWTANESTRSWERTNANNLSVHVKDQNGNPCDITVTQSGNTKKVYLFEDEHYEYHYESGYDENGDWYNSHWGTLEEVERVYVEIPEKVTIVLNQNGNKLAEVIIDTDLSSIVGENFNLKEDKYNVKATVYFNGYTMALENLYYENNKESKANFYFKHGDKTLLTANLTATPEMYVTDFSGDDGFIDFDNWEEGNYNSKNNFAYINILDKLELKGNCANLLELIKVIDEEWDENTASKVNRHLKMYAHFYGEEEPTATIKFETEVDEWYGYDYDEYGYWVERWWIDFDLVPIMEFSDYSRHSLEDFFNEEDFKKTIDAFESLFNQFEDLLRGYDFDF